MNFYFDIQLQFEMEISETFLLNEVYFRLHQALVRVGEGKIGISFPNFKKTLGNRIRLHSDEKSLQMLMKETWSRGIEDNISVSQITQIPEKVEYRVVSRVQVKSSPLRLLRRSVKKGWITEEEALKRLSVLSEKNTSLPYIRLRSLSTQQTFRLFIEHGPIVDAANEGRFSAYGLSSTATIPWF